MYLQHSREPSLRSPIASPAVIQGASGAELLTATLSRRASSSRLASNVPLSYCITAIICLLLAANIVLLPSLGRVIRQRRRRKAPEELDDYIRTMYNPPQSSSAHRRARVVAPVARAPAIIPDNRSASSVTNRVRRFWSSKPAPPPSVSSSSELPPIQPLNLQQPASAEPNAGPSSESIRSRKSRMDSILKSKKQPSRYVAMEDVKRCADLIRELYALDLEIWASEGQDETVVGPKKRQGEGILREVKAIVQAWEGADRMGLSVEEQTMMDLICNTIRNQPQPRY